MLMETLKNICSSGRSIMVAKQETLVTPEKFPYLPSVPWDNCLSHRPGVTDWHRISKQHSFSECSSTLGRNLLYKISELKYAFKPMF